MADVFRLTVDGEPTPSQMPTLLPNGQILVDKRVAKYQKNVALLARLAAMRAQWTNPAAETPLELTARFYVGNARTVDGDNLLKAAADSLKRVVFPDDKQIMNYHIYKRIDRAKPRTEVTIACLAEPLDDAPLNPPSFCPECGCSFDNIKP